MAEKFTTIRFKDGKTSPKKFNANIQTTAKKIIETLAEIDRKNNNEPLFEFMHVLDQLDINIRINTNELGNNGLLSFVFLRPQSEDYNDSKRCYQDKLYGLKVWDGDPKDYANMGFIDKDCKLSTQWRNAKYDQSGNYLWALIKMVNIYYSDLLTIESEFER